MSPVKTCLVCGRTIQGRSDKKFCTDYCRNTHNNRLNESDRSYMRQINKALAKNRRILASLLNTTNSATTRTTRDNLLLRGFHFSFTTHSYTTKAGKTYCYCYDYGYLPLDNFWYLVVRKETR